MTHHVIVERERTKEEIEEFRVNPKSWISEEPWDDEPEYA